MNKDKKVIRLMVSYSMIMIIPVIIVSIIVVSFFFAKIQEDTRNLNINVLKQVNSGVDTALKRAIAASYQLVETDSIIDLLNYKYEDNAARNVLLWKIKKNMSTYCIEGDIIVNVAIYSNINDVFVDMSTVYSIDEYYSHFLTSSEISSEQFYSMMTDNLSTPAFISTADSILYCSRLKSSNNKTRGVYIATLSKQGIIAEFKEAVLDSQIGFALVDSSGNLLLESENLNNKLYEKIINDEYGISNHGSDSVLKYHSAEIRNLDYAYTFPENNLSGNVRKMLWIFLMLLFASVGVSGVFAKKRMKSMKNIITYIFDENVALENNLEKQIEKSKEQLLFNLLHGNNICDLERHSNSINFQHNKLCVMLIKIINYGTDQGSVYMDELSIIENEINNLIIKYFEKTDIGCCSVSEKATGHIYILDYNNATYIKTLLNNLQEDFNKAYKLETILAIGKETDDVNHISESYESARSALRYGMKTCVETGSIVYYENIKDSENVKMYYTTDKENQLIKSIKMGLTDETEKIFDDIYNINFKEKQLSNGAVKQLTLSILNTMYGIVDDLYPEDVAKHDEFGRVCSNVMCHSFIEVEYKKFYRNGNLRYC